MKETPGQRLARLREEKGLSQIALAKAANVSQGTIGNIETEIRGYGKSIASIARVLGVTTDYLDCKTESVTAAPAIPEPVGYSSEALALAWLLDQVPRRIDKVRANAAATAAILEVLHGKSVGSPTHTPAGRETPAKPTA